jgi:sulfite exporter TauE/SafE
VALSALISAWIAGTLGGAHCLAMCGGFLAAMSGAAAPSNARPILPARALILRQIPYNVGRIVTYALLGAAFGAAGAATMSASAGLPLQRALYVVANVFLLALALAIAGPRGGIAWLERAGAALFGRLVPAMRPLLAHDAAGARLVVGLFWGLVPCALVYGVLPIALFAGGPLQGAAVMLAFGLGTLPNLVAAGWLLARTRRWFDRRGVRVAAAILLAAFAAVGIWRALTATGDLAQGPFCLTT